MPAPFNLDSDALERIIAEAKDLVYAAPAIKAYSPLLKIIGTAAAKRELSNIVGGFAPGTGSPGYEVLRSVLDATFGSPQQPSPLNTGNAIPSAGQGGGQQQGPLGGGQPQGQ